MGAEMSLYNLHDGYAEAAVRGNRSALLTPEDYRKLTLCETLEDLRSALEDTDYAGFMQDEPLPITVTAISSRLREKMTDEFRVLQSLADFPLRQFLEFIVAERMIDNVVSLIQGAMNGKSQEELLAKADPLGWTPEMKALLAIDSTNGYEDLYRTVLVETPVGGYFEDYLEKKQEAGDNENLSELDLEIMRASLKKSWLEDFYAFCCKLPGATTREIMCDILCKQADFLCLSVTLNSLNSPMGGQTKLSDRSQLFPHFGYLYPAATEALRKATNEQNIRAAIETYPLYLEVFEQCRGYYIREDQQGGANTVPESQLSLEDALYRQELTIYEMAFEQQMHYAIFYAWVKLKEQEIRNILWVADMILMHRRDTCMDMVLPIFAPRV